MSTIHPSPPTTALSFWHSHLPDGSPLLSLVQPSSHDSGAYTLRHFLWHIKDYTLC